GAAGTASAAMAADDDAAMAELLGTAPSSANVAVAERKSSGPADMPALEAVPALPAPASALQRRRRRNLYKFPRSWAHGGRFLRFANVGGRSGVLVGGVRPLWYGCPLTSQRRRWTPSDLLWNSLCGAA